MDMTRRVAEFLAGKKTPAGKENVFHTPARDRQHSGTNTASLAEQLHFAIRIGDADTITNILSRKQPQPVLNFRDTNGDTALHVAAMAMNAQAIEQLLAAGANIMQRDADGFTALHHALTGAEIDCVAPLLKAQVRMLPEEIRTQLPDDMPAYRELARMLIDDEIDIDWASDISFAKAVATASPSPCHLVLPASAPSRQTPNDGDWHPSPLRPTQLRFDTPSKEPTHTPQTPLGAS